MPAATSQAAPALSKPESENLGKATQSYDELMSTCVELLDRGSSQNDWRIISRVIRRIPFLRRNVQIDVLVSFINNVLSPCLSDESKQSMDKIFEIARCQTVWGATKGDNGSSHAPAKSSTLPSVSNQCLVSAWAFVLLIIFAIDSSNMIVQRSALKKNDKLDEARMVDVPQEELTVEEAKAIRLRICELCLPICQSLKHLLLSQSSFSLPDPLVAKCMFYFVRPFDILVRTIHIRADLMHFYRLSCAEKLDLTKACLINLLLKSYLDHCQPDSAVKFVSKVTFPNNLRSAPQVVRYLYYLGRTQALTLDYGEANDKLVQALGKLPAHGNYALGFRLQVQKYLIIVQLLMGDLPERSLFEQANIGDSLMPYENLVRAVKTGDLKAFETTRSAYRQLFDADGTSFFVDRLHHSVIRAGIRKIHMTYSQIPLSEVAVKLGLQSAEDVEGIVAKAISDQIIEGQIDHTKKSLINKTFPDIYTTVEPTEAFHRRIKFCIGLHKDAVRAMQYRGGETTIMQEPKNTEECRDGALEGYDDYQDYGDDFDFL